MSEGGVEMILLPNGSHELLTSNFFLLPFFGPIV